MNLQQDDTAYVYVSLCHGGAVVFACLDIEKQKDCIAAQVATEIRAGNRVERFPASDLKDKQFGCKKCGYCQRKKEYDARL